MKRLLAILLTALIFFTVFLIIKENKGQDNAIENTEGNGDWVGAWATSLQAPLEDGVSSTGFEDQTIRLIVNPHIDGKTMRIRLSNSFGSEPLSIEKVNTAVSKGGSQIDLATDQQITFGGDQKVTIPAGEKVFSDPISFEVSSGQELAVSLYVRNATGPVAWHPRAMQTNYIANGNHVSNGDASAFQEEEEAWFILDGVDVVPDPSVKGSIVVLGDSIANGNYSKLNANERWPDYLAKRLNDGTSDLKLSVLNAGVSANQLINSHLDKGENAFDRLERDVFSQTGVKGVILNQGLNDIRHYPEYDAEKIIERMKEIIDATHEEGLKIYGGTLTPYKGSGMFTAKGEAVRQEVNDWIRTSGEFDGVIDFDEALRDSDDPERFAPKYDSGDHFHPNNDGYMKMAETVDLTLFE